MAFSITPPPAVVSGKPRSNSVFHSRPSEGPLAAEEAAGAAVGGDLARRGRRPVGLGGVAGAVVAGVVAALGVLRGAHGAAVDLVVAGRVLDRVVLLVGVVTVPM